MGRPLRTLARGLSCCSRQSSVLLQGLHAVAICHNIVMNDLRITAMIRYCGHILRPVTSLCEIVTPAIGKTPGFAILLCLTCKFRCECHTLWLANRRSWASPSRRWTCPCTAGWWLRQGSSPSQSPRAQTGQHSCAACHMDGRCLANGCASLDTSHGMYSGGAYLITRPSARKCPLALDSCPLPL